MKNHNGTHIVHVLSTILPSYFTTFCIVSLQAVLTQPLAIPARFLLEYATIVWSVVLNVTVLNGRIYEIAGTLLLVCITIAAKHLCNRTHVLRFVTQIPHRRPDYIACLRATTNLITAVCILAVDFRAFPRHLAKTETYGFALMDTGVGLYVFNNALVDGQRRGADATNARLTGRRLRHLFSGVAPLLLLGAGRFFVTSGIEYQQHVSEYGVHWNFFVTLALTRLLAMIVMAVLGDCKHGVAYATLAIMLLHQGGLLVGLGRWVIAADALAEDRRTAGWLRANREGVASLPGYVALYMACVVLSKWMMVPDANAAAEAAAETVPDWLDSGSGGSGSGSGAAREETEDGAVCTAKQLLQRTRRIAIATVCIGKLAWDCERAFGVSRRLADLGYVLWILFVAGVMSIAFMLLEVFYHCLVFWRARGNGNNGNNGAAADESPQVAAANRRTDDIGRYCPLLLAAINYNGLVFFVAANLMTGAVNLTFQTLLVDAAGCVFIVSVYMFVLCAIVVFLYVNEIRLKL